MSWRFARAFRWHIRPGSRVLEVGCGGSKWLPYFGKDLKCEVWGLDYSEYGVASARAALANAGVEGNIVLGDLFRTDGIAFGYFDVVWSGGFLEHFTQPADTVRTMARFLKPGGLMITEVPNMRGLMGRVHRTASPNFYSQHVLFTPEELDNAHTNAALDVVEAAAYFGTLEIGVVDLRTLCSRHPGLMPFITRTAEAIQTLATLPLWILRQQYDTAALSPYLFGVYRRGV